MFLLWDVIIKDWLWNRPELSRMREAAILCRMVLLVSLHRGCVLCRVNWEDSRVEMKIHIYIYFCVIHKKVHLLTFFSLQSTVSSSSTSFSCVKWCEGGNCSRDADKIAWGTLSRNLHNVWCWGWLRNVILPCASFFIAMYIWKYILWDLHLHFSRCKNNKKRNDMKIRKFSYFFHLPQNDTIISISLHTINLTMSL
jgi:hypothetical protein